MANDTKASSKHGLAAAQGHVPERADWTVDQQWGHYSPQEHRVWRTLYERQVQLLQGRACEAFLQGMKALPIRPDKIPEFGALSKILRRHTGWEVVAVPGLVPDEVFFEHLANRRFPAGQFIRKPHELDYLEEPDVFHDVFGHAPMLMNPVMADYIQAYGEGGLKAKGLGFLDHLARVYWYTVEFGLLLEKGQLRLYGAGIASSATETHFAVESASPNRIRFALERVMCTRYRIDDFQQTYFVLGDLQELLQLASIDFTPLYERTASAQALDPGTILATDQVITKGTGAYHRARQAAAGR